MPGDAMLGSRAVRSRRAIRSACSTSAVTCRRPGQSFPTDPLTAPRLNLPSGEAARGALDQLSGEVHASVAAVFGQDRRRHGNVGGEPGAQGAASCRTSAPPLQRQDRSRPGGACYRPGRLRCITGRSSGRTAPAGSGGTGLPRRRIPAPGRDRSVIQLSLRLLLRLWPASHLIFWSDRTGFRLRRNQPLLFLLLPRLRGGLFLLGLVALSTFESIIRLPQAQSPCDSLSCLSLPPGPPHPSLAMNTPVPPKAGKTSSAKERICHKLCNADM